MPSLVRCIRCCFYDNAHFENTHIYHKISSGNNKSWWRKMSKWLKLSFGVLSFNCILWFFSLKYPSFVERNKLQTIQFHFRCLATCNIAYYISIHNLDMNIPRYCRRNIFQEVAAITTLIHRFEYILIEDNNCSITGWKNL